MRKLKLKRTPAEDAQREYKKARKAASSGTSSKSQRDKEYQRRKRAGAQAYHVHRDSEPEAGPSGRDDRASQLESEAEAARVAQALDEARFQEKMMNALADDGLTDPLQRLDGVEARLNDYAHVPRRWRGTEPGFSDALRNAEEEIGVEPWQMNDDEYAEYIRSGIWKRQNQTELDERRRKKEKREAKAQYARTLREETARLEREEHECKRQKKLEKKRKTQVKLWKDYEERWVTLSDVDRNAHPGKEGKENLKELRFSDIPWPVLVEDANDTLSHIRVDDINPDAVGAFLRLSVPAHHTEGLADRLNDLLNSAPPPPPLPVDLKDVLRATMLRFHPDKFEVRILKRVRSSDRQRVKEVASAVVRAVSELMRDGNDKP